MRVGQATLGQDALSNDMRASMLKPEIRAAMEAMINTHRSQAERKADNVSKAAGLFKRKLSPKPAADVAGQGGESGVAEVIPAGSAGAGGSGRKAFAAWGVAVDENQPPARPKPRPQSAGAVSSSGSVVSPTGAWRPPARPQSAAASSSASRPGSAVSLRRPRSADSAHRLGGTIRASVSLLA